VTADRTSPVTAFLRPAPTAGRTSPLAALIQAAPAGPEPGLLLRNPAVTIAEVPFLTQLNLRLDPAGASALGLPAEPCTSTTAGDVTTLWLGPDEWLLIAPPGTEAPLTERLTTTIGPAHGSVTDVSAQRTTLDLTGPGVRDLLAHGCALDLHPRAFPPGACVQTELAHTPVILFHHAPGLRLLVRASYATHLATWLQDAARE
jgi:sarcosine oxidase subunit gamma